MTAILTIKSPAYFDRLAEVEAAHWWSRAMWRLAARWLDRALRGRTGLEALDVGCGTGLTAVRLARRAEIGHVVGLDPSPDALDHARHRHDFPLVLGSATELPFDDGQFDVVTCFDVLQHLPPAGDRRAMTQIFRVLRPGGVAVIRSNAARRFGARAGDGYALKGLIEVIGSSGLVVTRATYANCLPALAQEARGLLSRRHQSHPSGGGLQVRVPSKGINRLMGVVATFEAELAGCGVRLPFGHGTMVLGCKEKTSPQRHKEHKGSTKK